MMREKSACYQKFSFRVKLVFRSRCVCGTSRQYSLAALNILLRSPGPGKLKRLNLILFSLFSISLYLAICSGKTIERQSCRCQPLNNCKGCDLMMKNLIFIINYLTCQSLRRLKITCMFNDVICYYRNLVPRLNDEEITALEERFAVRYLRKGDHLVKAGQTCRHVSFINSGLLRVYYDCDGKDISICFAGPGDYTTEYESFITRKPAFQHIEALTDAVTIDLGYDDMQVLYKRYPVFQEFGRKIAEMLYILLNQRNTALLALSPEERYREMVESNSFLLQNVPQYMLASYIGVTPEHLSRLRKKMSVH